MRIEMTNEEICNKVEQLKEAFPLGGGERIPISINFFIQKNIDILENLYREIENAKMSIGKKYGKLDEDGQYVVPNEKSNEAMTELSELYNLTQSFEISGVSQSNLFDKEEVTRMTSEQVKAILFMVEEDK